MISDADLLAYSRNALIPGPDEGEDAFLKRCSCCLEIEKNLKENHQLPVLNERSEYDKMLLKDVFPSTEALYDIHPNWVPLSISNHRLAPWHGGCAWIFQLHSDSPKSALLQLREGNVFFYRQSEIVAHELAHVGRMCFEEPLFEEMLAYQSSHRPWRRWLGPIVQSAKEGVFFVSLLFFIFAFDLYSLFISRDSELWVLASWLKLLPLIAVFAALARLYWRHQIFKRSLKNMTDAVKSTQKAQAILYRLTDREISLFSSMQPEEILNYLRQQAPHSLRARLLAIYAQT